MRGHPQGDHQKGSLPLGVEGIGFVPEARGVQDNQAWFGFDVVNLFPKWKPRHRAGVLQDEFTVTDGPVTVLGRTSALAAIQVQAQHMVTGMVVLGLREHARLVVHGDAARLDPEIPDIAHPMCSQQVVAVGVFHPTPKSMGLLKQLTLVNTPLL